MVAMLNTIRVFSQHDMFDDSITKSVDNSDMSFGKRLSLARKNLKLTQPELAKLCGWESQSRISMYERDQREPSNKELVRLADVLGVTTDWLLRDNDKSRNASELPPHVLQLARLIAKAPPGKVKAILMLLGVEEKDIQKEDKKDPPSPWQGKKKPGAKERRHYEDRRHNVHTVDFERRSGLDRRDDEVVIMGPGESLKDFRAKQEEEENKKKDKDKDKEP